MCRPSPLDMAEGKIDLPSNNEPMEKHGHRCREAVVLAVRAFLGLLEGAVTGDTIPLETVRRIASAVMTAEGALSHYYDLHSNGCAAFFEMVKTERKRTDFFGRVITEPLVPLFNDATSGIQRESLQPFFAAVRVTLGDELHTEFKDRCLRIASSIRGEANVLLWPDFFADARTLDILESVQVAMARSFRNFAQRKEWFIRVMNADPHSLAPGGTGSIPQEADEALPRMFGDAHFVRLFRAFYSGATQEKYDEARRDAFLGKFGAPPERIFGPFLSDLSTLEQQIAKKTPSVPKRR